MNGTFEIFEIDGGFAFIVSIAPPGREPKPFPWDGRSYNTRAQAIAAARKSPWIA